MNDIFISVDNANDVIQLPIPPQEVEVSTGKNNTTFSALTEELIIIGNDTLENISFSSFFPSKYYPFSRDRKYLGFEYVNKILSWKSSKKIIRLIVNNTNINTDVVIDSFDYRTQDATGDVYYSISFTKYKKADVTIKAIPKPSTGNSGGSSNYRTITGNRVHFRSGPGTNYKSMGYFYKGDSVLLISQSGNWCYIEYKGTKGYVHSDYVSKSSSTTQNVSATLNYPTIKYGSRGDNVKDAQTKLNKLGCNISVDGIFGSKTQSATKSIQKKNKLSQDGIIGPKTWKVLNQ